MSAQMEIEHIAKQLPTRQQTPMDLLQIAVSNSSGIDVIERLAALQDKALARDAEIDFNLAMNAVQSELGRIAPDLNNPQTKSRYASYAALDKVLRPLYTKHGFSLSFDSGESPADTVIAYCFVSHRSGHTRKYQSPAMPADGKGAKGGDVMTKTHATGAAMSYGMRYLLKFIFNVAIGEDDTDGNSPVMDQDELAERLEHFGRCETFAELESHFRASYIEAKKSGDVAAQNLVIAAKDRQKAALKKAGAQ